MTGYGLAEREWDAVIGVLRHYESVTGTVLYGSRAKGTAKPASDIDLALEGVDDPLTAERIAAELDALPLPYQFDVRSLSAIRSPELLDHIRRVGVRVC